MADFSITAIPHNHIQRLQARMIPQPISTQALQNIVGKLLTDARGIPANLTFAIHTTESEAQAAREKLV
ncbi:MAG: hypothetical protein WC645_04945 [Candidatus Margulisiibacteriota bacterium]